MADKVGIKLDKYNIEETNVGKLFIKTFWLFIDFYFMCGIGLAYNFGKNQTFGVGKGLFRIF